MARIVIRIIRIVTSMVRIITRILTTKFDRIWNYPNRKWNYFSNFQASDQKTPFTKCFTFDTRGSKSIFKTGNGLIQTGNGIISLTFKPLIKKLLYKMFHIWSKGLNINFQNRKWNCPNRVMELFLLLPCLWSKNSFFKMFHIWTNGFKINF